MGVPTYNAKQKILTRYNEKTHKIRLLVQDLVRGTKEVGPLYAPTCWKYLDTNELLAMPEKMIIKGVQWA
jgi:hypothetical protein